MMNSTKNFGFAPATRHEIKAWNYRVALEKQEKEAAKLKTKDLKRKQNGTQPSLPISTGN